MINSNEYKRYQAPPVLRISSKAFGAGRRMPLVAKILEADNSDLQRTIIEPPLVQFCDINHLQL